MAQQAAELTLVITNPTETGGGASIEHSFGTRGGSIGTAASDSWQLSPHRTGAVAGHAEVRYLDGGFCLIDRSGRTYINSSSQPVGRGRRARLSHGDTVTIGRYQIRAELSGVPAAVGETDHDAREDHALVDAPESIVKIDIGFLEDREFGDAHYNIATGFIAAPRGNERDEGSNTMNSVGPGQMVMHPDGQRLFVSNFNRNSVTVYDLRIGPYGSAIREIRNVGENPYGLAISPDGHHLVVSNYIGEVEDRVAHATLGIIDINPDSSTYLEAVSWIVNR